MGPLNCLYTWRTTNGSTMPSRLDRFLSSTELVELFPLADVRLLPRPLSDHTPIVWASNEGHRLSTYLKIDKSWLRKVGFKEEVEREWSSQVNHGSETKRLANKITGLQRSLMVRRKHIWEERSKRRYEALTRIKQVDHLEDMQGLEEEEVKERKAWQNIVEGEDWKLEIDRRQQSRQLWLHEKDTNMEFFHMLANGRRRQNQIIKITVGNQVYVGSQVVGQTLSEHFNLSLRKGT